MLNKVGSLLKINSNFFGSGAWSTSDTVLIVSLTLSAVSPHPFSNPHSFNLIISNKKSAKRNTPLLHNLSNNNIIEKKNGHLSSKLWNGASFGNVETWLSATINAPWRPSTVSSVSSIRSFCVFQAKIKNNRLIIINFLATKSSLMSLSVFGF